MPTVERKFKATVDRVSGSVFIKRKVQEDVCSESQDSDDDLDPPPDINNTLRRLLPEPLDYDDQDPAATMARFSLEVCSNKALTWKTRTQAVGIIRGIAHYKPVSLEEYELVNPILQAMLQLLLLGECSAGFRRRLAYAARSVVRNMSLNHPEQVFQSVLEFATLDPAPKYYLSRKTSKKMHRGAVLGALVSITEGCSGLMKDKLEPLLGIVAGAHRDPECWVRYAASHALRKFVDHLLPEMVSRRHTVLPCILSGLDDGNWQPTVENSYESLEALCDSMTGEEILPFLDPIMNRLLTDLHEREEFFRQFGSFYTMCSVAAAADQHFVPYTGRVLEALTRTRATSLTAENFVFAGALVKTLGKRAGMEPTLFPYIEAAVLGWPDWICPDRTHAYGFFCTAAETLGGGFAKYLPDVVPLAICSCNLYDSAAETRSFHRTRRLDEKAAAARALGLFAVHTKTAFAPYLEESLSAVINFSAHYHEDVRLQGVIGLRNILTAAAAVSESPSGGAAEAKQLLGTVMDRYIKAMDEDGDKRVVAQVCTDTAGILDDFGYAALEPHVPQIIYSVLRLLQGQSACRRADDAEHEETLMAAVSNLRSALAKAVATSPFAPSMHSMLSDAYIKLSEAPGSSRYRTTAAA